ncbi:uroporphyrinogen-III synthase [Paenibacillus spongiae]|uniref:Uroporphyrinogen-III synthase n=1 Tax=Paenibacillus spongiae TaxID=2909671 RepID=A0ABY5SL02_9BACL|nr:uroporphyrinogen-III synthase [Paenibacillus spongiae]UVI33340.1 uroporphyrinogen-III synthase [Paenibacillus spongiae]
MAKGLEGKRIAITGSRKIQELSKIIERQGGIPIVRPQQGMLVLQEHEVEHDLTQLIESGTDWAIFTTGTGLEALLQQAERIGVYERLLEIVRQTNVGARGYKTVAMLKKLGIQPIAIDDDGTTEGLIRVLQAYDFSGLGVTIQLHGEPMPSLVTYLEGKGAVVRTILPYKQVAPDRDISERLCREILEGSVDAVCFTTAVQVRYFYQYVSSHGKYLEINENFHNRVLAVAVGRVTAEALKEAGVRRVLVPENERMGAMIVEVARYYRNKTALQGMVE